MSEFFIDPDTGEAFLDYTAPDAVPEPTSIFSRVVGGLTSFITGAAEAAPSLAQAYQMVKGEPMIETAQIPQQYDMGWYPTVQPQDPETGIPIQSLVVQARPPSSGVAGITIPQQEAAITIPVVILGGILIYALLSGKVKW